MKKVIILILFLQSFCLNAQNISIISGSNPVCAGGSVTLQYNPAVTTLVQWSATCGVMLLLPCPVPSPCYFTTCVFTPTVNCTSVIITAFNSTGTLGTIILNIASLSDINNAAISGAIPICSGNADTLTISNGSLGTNANWNWYTGSCGGTYLISGISLTITPTTTTTYFVRAEGLCNTTACISSTVLLNLLSTAATSATATPSNIYAGTMPSTLSVNNGTLGTGGIWKWYSGSCNGTPVGTGSSILVSPTLTTLYYARAEGPCNTTTCVSVYVTVSYCSVAPTSANAVPSTINQGSTTTLSVTGGFLGTMAQWRWYKGACGSTFVGIGYSTIQSPSVTTSYFVRADGTCNTTACASVTVTVIPSFISSLSASLDRFIIYPNPANDKLNVEFTTTSPLKEIAFTLYNYIGQAVLAEKLNKVQSGIIEKTFDINYLSNGLYQFHIKLSDGTTINRKILIEK